MVLRRLAAASLFCLGAAIFVILLHPSSASACGAISYKGDGGSLGSFKKCPSGPGDAGIGAAGGLLAGGTAGGAWWAYRHGGKAAGSALSQPKPAPNPHRNWSGPEPKPNPYGRPVRGGDPKVGDPKTIPGSPEIPTKGGKSKWDIPKEVTQAVTGTVQHATGVGVPHPAGVSAPSTAPSPEYLGTLVQMALVVPLGIKIRLQRRAERIREQERAKRIRELEQHAHE